MIIFYYRKTGSSRSSVVNDLRMLRIEGKAKIYYLKHTKIEDKDDIAEMVCVCEEMIVNDDESCISIKIKL